MREKKTNRWLRGVLLLCLTILFGAASVVAAPLDETAREGLSKEIGAFVEQVYQMDDAMLEQYRASGGFYEVMVDAIRDNAEDLGALKEVRGVHVEDGGDEVVARVDAAFEKYDADLVVYMNADSYEPKNFVVEPDFPFGKKMSQAGQNTVTGLMIVFVVLFFLMFVISLFKYINPETRKKKQPERDLIVPDVIEPAGAPVAAAPVGGGDEEIAAVIAAAIAAAQESEPSGSGYVVRSVKRRTTHRNKLRG